MSFSLHGVLAANSPAADSVEACSPPCSPDIFPVPRRVSPRRRVRLPRRCCPKLEQKVPQLEPRVAQRQIPVSLAVLPTPLPVDACSAYFQLHKGCCRALQLRGLVVCHVRGTHKTADILLQVAPRQHEGELGREVFDLRADAVGTFYLLSLHLQ